MPLGVIHRPLHLERLTKLSDLKLTKTDGGTAQREGDYKNPKGTS